MQAGEPVMVTLAELARLKGVSKPAITKRIKKLSAEGLIAVTVDGSNKRVDLAAYDRAIGATGSPAHEQAAATAKAEAPAADTHSSTFRDAQTLKAQADARRAVLDVEERIGNLAPIKGPGGIEDAMVEIGQAIIAAIDLVGNHADKLTQAARSGGEAAVRRQLRIMRDELRGAMTKALAPIIEDGKAVEASGGTETDLNG